MKIFKKEEKIVQGTYITVKNQAILRREARRVGTTPTHLASIMLENSLKRISTFKRTTPRKESMDENSSGDVAKNDL